MPMSVGRFTEQNTKRADSSFVNYRFKLLFKPLLKIKVY